MTGYCKILGSCAAIVLLAALATGCSKPSTSITVVDFLGTGQTRETITLTIHDQKGTFVLHGQQPQHVVQFNLPGPGNYHYSATGVTEHYNAQGVLVASQGAGNGVLHVQAGKRYMIKQDFNTYPYSIFLAEVP